MTNIELIQAIKAEIERRITDNTFCAKLELMDILAWLDTIESGSSEIPNDLEEAARVHAHCPFTDEEGNFHEDAIDASAYWDFIAGSNWQKEQDNYDTIFHKGMMYYRKQMMEEAVEGEVTTDNRGNNVVRTGVFNKDFEYGDKVRIIVIPNTDEK